MQQRRTMFATGLALTVVLLVQASPFTYGYRRVADEVAYLEIAMGGWSAIAEATTRLATTQGRLGHLASVPISILGSFLSDSYWVRLVFVLMHFGVFVLFAAYVSRVLATKVTFPLLILLLTLQPIGADSDHMPPINYPLQNTLPLVMLFAARLTILEGESRGRTGGFTIALARLVFLIALVLNEYTFLAGTAVLACEYLARWGRRLDGASGPTTAKLRSLCDRSLLLDAGLVVLAFASYIGFRSIFPSQYEGNVLDAVNLPWRIVATTIGHVHAGTFFSHDLDIGPIPRQAIPLAALAGLLTAVCSCVVLGQARAIATPITIIVVCVVAIAYVTFPLASNAKFQGWCLEGGACGSLDSRISYLGYALILLCLIALALRLMPTRLTTWAMVAVLSGVLGLLGAASYAHNLRIGLVHANDALVWHRANLLACHPDLQSPSDRRLLRMIDPDARVRFHPGTDKAHFWRNYLTLKSKNQSCPPEDERRQAERRLLNDSEPVLAVGQDVRFSRPSAVRYLGGGWSAREEAGIWTDGARAELAFVVAPGPPLGPLVLKVDFTAYVRPNLPAQTVDVYVDGRRVDTWTIVRAVNDGRAQERAIPIEPGRQAAEEIKVVFHILSPRQPEADREIADSRHLGIFLLSIVLESQPR